MPRAALLPEQAARVAAGLCGAAGCGARIDSPSWAPRIYCSPACRQRGHRERARAGADVPQDVRQRRAWKAEAEQLRAQAAEAEGKARGYLAHAKQLREAAEVLAARASGQVALFDVRRAR